jgi:hypothetical protein
MDGRVVISSKQGARGVGGRGAVAGGGGCESSHAWLSQVPSTTLVLSSGIKGERRGSDVLVTVSL